MFVSVSLWSKHNNDRLPSSEPDDGSSGYRFLGQPGTEAYDAINENVSEDIFSCPSWGKSEPFYYSAGKRWVWQRGSLYLGNLETDNFTVNRYESPKSFRDKNTKAIFACRTVRSDYHKVTVFAHSAKGYFRSRPAVEPDKAGCEGTNVVRLDGSSVFERSLQKYAAEPFGLTFVYFTEK